VAASACTWLPAVERKKWPDWFAVPVHLATQLDKIPGVHRLRDGTPLVHRSHLPLFTQPITIEANYSEGTYAAAWSLYRNPNDQILPLDTFRRALAKMSPRDYQRVGAKFLRSRHGALLADQMRLGKSLQAALSHDPKDGPLVVAGPLNVRPVWLKLFRLLWPEVPFVALDGRQYDKQTITGAKLVYVHYDILPTWQTYDWKRIGLLVLDEIHVLSNSKSLRSQAASLLALRAERIVGLSGTPAWNEPADMYTMLTCLTPSAWGKWYEFAARYASGQKGLYGFRTGDPSHVEEFRARMSEIMFRRIWEDVRDELPPTKREIKVLHLTPEQDRQVTFLCNALRNEDAESTIIGTLARLRRVLGELKLEYLYEVIQPWIGSPFVIWCWHQDVAKAVAVELKLRGNDVYLVHGGTSQYRSKKTGEVKREEILDAWRAAPAGILVTTISVGQVGIDLSHASRAVFTELDFTPATISQAEMRTFSPEREMEIIYLAVHHAVDEAIIEALKGKFAWSDVMGVASSEAAITVLGGAFGLEDAGDLNRLRMAILSEEEEQ
jgi:SNF2 family DNA or RNA helicase